MVEHPVTLCNIPLDLRDVQLMIQILQSIGVSVTATGPHSLVVDASAVPAPDIPARFMSQMRASLFFMGPLLARIGQVIVSRPGGCEIGVRPIDLHLKGLSCLGAVFEDLPAGRLKASVQQLLGSPVYLDYPSVGATENIMMAAVLARGETVIENAAREPEIVDLAQFLNKTGARIRGAGTDTMVVDGVQTLCGATHAVIPDRIEAGTVAVAAAITHGSVEITGTIPEHLGPLWRKLNEMGVAVSFVPGSDRVVVESSSWLRPVEARTGPYPGFPTDLQPLLVALMTQAEGVSSVVETVFENRLKYVTELGRMGARILTDGRMAIIYGPTPLTGNTVEATDLRAGAALVVAALACPGATRVRGSEMIERGYQNLPARLSELGANIHQE